MTSEGFGLETRCDVNARAVFTAPMPVTTT
jgi:hypothetical protein